MRSIPICNNDARLQLWRVFLRHGRGLVRFRHGFRFGGEITVEVRVHTLLGVMHVLLTRQPGETQLQDKPPRLIKS